MNPLRHLHRHLDPADTLGELIFGLIMVLTFTLGARLLGPAEPLDSRELLVAALGCNLAWGIIDGFLYLLAQVYERRRLATLKARLRAEHDGPAALLLRAELDGALTALAPPAERRQFYGHIAAGARIAPGDVVRVTAEDLRGALLIFVLVTLTAVPAALPFLAIEDSYVALRTSNAVLTALLFVIGYCWGKSIGARPVLAGALIMSIGIALVLVAIPLGG